MISNLGIFIKVFTTIPNGWYILNQLWIDFKSWYIYQSIYNANSKHSKSLSVVNWFQILVYLSKYLQQNQQQNLQVHCCELISNLGIFIKVFTTNPLKLKVPSLLWIDFKSWYIYQSIYNNVLDQKGSRRVVNWFQILVYLSKYLQLNINSNTSSFGCELISNLGIFIKVFTTGKA